MKEKYSKINVINMNCIPKIKVLILLTVNITLLDLRIAKAQTFIEDTIPDVISLWGCSGDWKDYDNDGDKDLLIAGIIGNTGVRTTRIYRNDNNSVFTNINATLLDGVSSGSVAWGDYNNDGALDVLLTGFNGVLAISKLYKNIGGIFIPDTVTLPEITLGEAKFGDYDEDGDLDIAITGWHTPMTGNWQFLTKIFRNDGDGVFADINAALIPLQISSLDWGDMDGDGDLDLLVIGQDADNVDHSEIYRNDGGDVFSDISAGLTGVRGTVCKWGDYDNDGNNDFFIAGYNGSTPEFIIYKNLGGNIFTPVTTNIEGGVSGDADWGDYDNDGLLDIITSGNNLTMKVTNIYHNNGNDNFSLLPQTFPGLNTSASLWADYTGDGKLDFVISGESNTPGYTLTRFYKQNPSTRVSEEQIMDDVTICPNPTSGYFTLRTEDAKPVDEVEICNLPGELIYRSDNFSQLVEIDISNRSKGIYFVKIRSGERCYTRKIVFE